MKNAFNIIGLLLFGAACFFVGQKTTNPSYHHVGSDTVWVLDTVRLSQPYPVFLQGETIVLEDTTKLDSLKRVYKDSIGTLVDELAKPFTSRYDDKIRTSIITAFPIEKRIKDSTFYKPIPVTVPQITNTEQLEPSFWEYVEAGVVGAAVGALIILIAN